MTRYSDRERGFEFMEWVRTLPCVVSRIGGAGILEAPMTGFGRCVGPVQADHAGRRSGMSHKALDRTCIPMCMTHHVQRTEYRGVFGHITLDQRRDWCAAAIAHTHDVARQYGMVVPEC